MNIIFWLIYFIIYLIWLKSKKYNYKELSLFKILIIIFIGGPYMWIFTIYYYLTKVFDKKIDNSFKK